MSYEAQVLEFVFEKAVKKDIKGNIIGIDLALIEEKFGSSPELEELKNKIAGDEVQALDAAVDRCVERKLKATYVDLVTGAIFDEIVDYIASGKYDKAAGKIVKVIAKGSIITIAGELAWILGSCIYEVNGL